MRNPLCIKKWLPTRKVGVVKIPECFCNKRGFPFDYHNWGHNTPH